jgi:hypothetical protein
MFRISAGVILLLSTFGAIHAQVGGRISGYVRDRFRTTETDTAGYHELLAMPPATYDVTVDKRNAFSTATLRRHLPSKQKMNFAGRRLSGA